MKFRESQRDKRCQKRASEGNPSCNFRGQLEAVDAAWIRSVRWIVREQGSGTRSTFEEVLRAQGVNPGDLQITMVMPSNEAVRSAVEAGSGVAVLSELVVRRALAAGDLQALPFPIPVRPFHALRHKERYRTRAADAMTDLLKEKQK